MLLAPFRWCVYVGVGNVFMRRKGNLQGRAYVKYLHSVWHTTTSLCSLSIWWRLLLLYALEQCQEILLKFTFRFTLWRLPYVCKLRNIVFKRDCEGIQASFDCFRKALRELATKERDSSQIWRDSDVVEGVLILRKRLQEKELLKNTFIFQRNRIWLRST